MSAGAIALAYAADRALGDPRRWHPVAGFGRARIAVLRRADNERLVAALATAVARC